MHRFNNGHPYHGSDKVTKGRLKGTTDTDYFYFICPECPTESVLRILDYDVVSDGPVEYAPQDRNDAQRDFVIAFELYCATCGLHDFAKVGNTGWQRGRLPPRG